MAETIQKSETEKIKQAEKVSIKEGSATAVMDGFGYRYITPYALALGSSNFFIALINTVPNFLGNLFQLHTLRLLKKRKRKTIVFTSAFLQALLWIPLIITGILYIKYPEISSSIPFFLLIFYSMIIITGAVSFPAWNSWMKDIITLNPGSFFGTRNKTVNLIVIISMFIAAAMLSFFNNLYFYLVSL